MKICKKCGEEKQLEDFHRSKGKKDGRHSYCKECAIKNSKKYYRDNHQEVLARAKVFTTNKKRKIKEIVDAIKENRGCARCDEADPCCLDFHHIYQKNNGISYLVASKSLAKLVEEIGKCVCVCSNCHRKITAGKVVLHETTPVVLLTKEEIDLLKGCLIYDVDLNLMNYSP